MNRLLYLCFACLCQLALYAQGGWANDGYDPENPPNPNLIYQLELNVYPQNAGYLNTSGVVKYAAETMVFLEAYANTGYVFDHWEENGDTLSKNSIYYYSMPHNSAAITAVFRYDPTNPGNPVSPQYKHMLQLMSQPDNAGGFNWATYSEVEQDTQVDICAYPNYNWRFKEWRLAGKVIGTDVELSFTMPDHAVTLVAIYEYDPVSPQNPGRNYWNNQTGEVIIDDFTPGYLNDAIYELVGGGDGKDPNVTMITVAGRALVTDWSVAKNYRSCTMLDMSRTTGLTYVPSWTFNKDSKIEIAVLPASIERIDKYAFYDCKELRELTCYAMTPPEVKENGFEGLDEGLIVYVPALAVNLYKEAEGWKDLTIFPLQSEVSSLEVNLPEGIDLSVYKGMYIELANLVSGQRQRYVITDRVTYTFSSLIHNTQYNVYLKNQKGEVLGQISDVKIANKDVSVTFASLLQPRNVTLQVQTPDEEDVTEAVTIVWSAADGTYLSKGSQLLAQMEGTTVHYRISLPQALGMQYLLPAEQEYEVVAENAIVYKLAAIPQTTIKGSVLDIKAGEPLDSATISVSQMLNGLYSKSFACKTDSTGAWSLQVYEAVSEITASKIGYLSKSLTNVQVAGEMEDIPTFELKDINGTSVALHLTYTTNAGETTEGYADYLNVAYTLKNVTTGEPITELSLQYPRIILMDLLPAGTVIEVTATSTMGKFLPVTATATVDELDRASVTLPIVQLGAISASYAHAENTGIVGILYDENGRLVTKYDYADASLFIDELADGSYTLVTMANSQYFNSVYSISQFASSGLREGMDYVKNKVNVSSGNIATITNQTVPYLDETRLYYTGNGTSFAVNKSQVTAGQYLTVSSHIDFKNAYASDVTDVKLIVDLPNASSFVDNSVMIGNSTSSYTYTGHTVIIPLDNYTERIRFCFIPTAGGSYSTSAAVQFTYGERTITQPIGNAAFSVKDLTLNVPAVVSNPVIPVSGSAVGRSTIKVYGDGILLGQTTALANGAWATTIEVERTDTLTNHEVYALVTTPQGALMQSEKQIVAYDPYAAQVSKVTMYYTNPEENWWRGKNYELVYNYMSPSVIPMKYVYYIYNRSFTFSIDFDKNDPASVSYVGLDVKTGDGNWHQLSTNFDTKQNRWMAYGEFGNMYDGVVPVNVRVRFVRSGGNIDTTNVENGYVVVSYPGPDTDVAIDPSGYVYEAVSSNRVQGATASIYYKENVEDEYGDLHERIVLWDAEEYAQENPLFTDESGMYRWDVPQGLWQVKFEKEGYQTTYSEWLPVPPPQLDVNIPMIQLTQPVVKNAKAYEEGVEVEFDKYMDPATLTSENIKLTCNGNTVEGTIVLLNEEVTYEGQAQTYASKLRFNVPEGAELLSTDDVQFTVSRQVKSYAGLPMQEDYSQSFEVEPKIRTIAIDSLVTIPYGDERTLIVAALPADASKGKKMLVNSLSSAIASANTNELVLDENGQAELKVTGEMPGSTVLTFGVENTDIEGRMQVSVKEAAMLITLAPRASRVSGTQVYRGTKIQLTCETQDAEIYYTLNGSSPLDMETALKYNADEPIIIASDTVVIKAVAHKADLEKSEVAEFTYTLKKTTLGYDMPMGWTWISHNLEDAIPVNTFATNAERIVSQNSEVIKDPLVGLIGNLKTLEPAKNYKVQVSEQTENRLTGYEWNASSQAVPVETGWNWIGYPVNQAMTLGEALEFHNASEGDYIVGQNGFAEFTEGEWKGSLEGLVPGKGYLYKSAVSTEIPFNTTIVSVAASRIGKRNLLMNSPWAPAKNAYPDVMPMTIELYANGVKATEEEYVVAAFVDSECRGVGIWQQGRVLMTVYGTPNDQISFMAVKLATDQYYQLEGQVTFSLDNQGTWNAPMVLTIGEEATNVKAMNSDFSVTPTIARDHITVNAGGREISSLTLTNMGGQVVMSVASPGKGATVATGSLPEGMYIVTVKAEGLSYYKKIMKANK